MFVLLDVCCGLQILQSEMLMFSLFLSSFTRSDLTEDNMETENAAAAAAAAFTASSQLKEAVLGRKPH